MEASEVEECAEQAAEAAERQTRDELLRTIYANAEDMTRQELGDAVGLSRSRVADMLSQSAQ